MKTLLFYLNGEQALHDLSQSAVYSGGRFQGTVETVQAHEEPQPDPPIVVVDVGHKQGARCIFTLRVDESYRQETGNLPVYRELPWVLAGDETPIG